MQRTAILSVILAACLTGCDTLSGTAADQQLAEAPAKVARGVDSVRSGSKTARQANAAGDPIVVDRGLDVVDYGAETVAGQVATLEQTAAQLSECDVALAKAQADLATATSTGGAYVLLIVVGAALGAAGVVAGYALPGKWSLAMGMMLGGAVLGLSGIFAPHIAVWAGWLTGWLMWGLLFAGIAAGATLVYRVAIDGEGSTFKGIVAMISRLRGVATVAGLVAIMATAGACHASVDDLRQEIKALASVPLVAETSAEKTRMWQVYNRAAVAGVASDAWVQAAVVVQRRDVERLRGAAK